MTERCTPDLCGQRARSASQGSITVERVALVLPRLPAEFNAMTVAVVSDIHAGSRNSGRASVAEVVERTNALGADLIVVLGDVVHSAANANSYLPVLSGLEANEGVYACLGNHEHGFVWYSRYLGASRAPSVDRWRALYAEAGIQLLVNEAKPLPRGRSRIWLLGVDDAYSGNDDLAAALAQARASEFCLALTHSPDLVDDPQVREVDLVLAGHTHGGQICFPLMGPLFAPCRQFRRRAAGLLRANGTTMYVTRGSGEALPVRINCPREISLVSLMCVQGPPLARDRERFRT
ncbi:MAG: metallophosphoesterase [Armatimonadota bacterium]|nr:MAG: metallophosphoesterase [Armatimonadota bacterium]